MFNKIKKYFSDKKDEKEVLNNPLYVVALKAGLKANEDLGLDKMAEKFRSIQGEYIGQQINLIGTAKDGLLALREMCSNVMLELCSYEVLNLNKDETDPTGLLKHPSISGELHKYIGKLFKNDKKFKELLHGIKHPAKVDEQYYKNLISGFYRHAAWKYEVVNAIRVHLKDFNTNVGKDWMNPFRFCVSVWQEADYRKKLKLKPLVSDINKIQYSTFTNLVLNGHKYPDLEFYESYKDSIKKKELYYPFKL